jgi:hypothetical protein
MIPSRGRARKGLDQWHKRGLDFMVAWAASAADGAHGFAMSDPGFCWRDAGLVVPQVGSIRGRSQPAGSQSNGRMSIARWDDVA